jgi:hypothetical protein
VSLLLLAAALLGGFLSTYLFEDDEGPVARLAMAVPIGFVALAFSGFVFASMFGLGGPAVALAGLVTLLPALALRDPGRRSRVRRDLVSARNALEDALRRPRPATHLVAIAFVLAAAVLWRVQDRAMFVTGAGGIHTGSDHNLGDLPFHVSIVTSFLHGENFPPEHPELAGARLTYPFLVDFLTALLMRTGADLRDALFAPNVLLSWSALVLLYHWGRRLTGSRAAGVVTAALVFLSGGLGFMLLKDEPDPTAGGLVAFLRTPQHDYSIVGHGPYRWGNLIITMLMPQRSFLLGLPAFLVVATTFWRAVTEVQAPEGPARRPRRLLGAGILIGLLPLAHAHTFVTCAGLAVLLALLFPPRREWVVALAAAGLLALPQVLFASHGTAMQATSFVAWSVGWDRSGVGVLSFWWHNLGLFLPLLVLALAWRGRAPVVPALLLRFYLPFTLWFLAPNLLRLSPWIWDNIKFLVFWHVASAPLVALLLVRLWTSGPRRAVLASLAFVVLVLSGALDVRRVVARKIDNAVFDAGSAAFASTLREATEPRAVVLHAPTYNSEVYLTGRRTVFGYPGHIWSQGLDGGRREDEVRAIYAGRPEAPALLRSLGIQYVLVGPLESAMDGFQDHAFRDFPIVAESADRRLYRVP